MRHLAILAVLPALLLVASCAKERPAPSAAESRSANMNAAAEADKSYSKENPADPAAFKEAPAK